MSSKDVGGMGEAELAQAIENARQELFNLRFQHATGRLADTSRLRQVRRELARYLTVQRERALWEAYEAASGEEA